MPEQNPAVGSYQLLDRLGVRNVQDLVMLPKGAEVRFKDKAGTLEGISFTYFKDSSPFCENQSGQVTRERYYLPLNFEFGSLPDHVKAENKEFLESTSMKIPLFYTVRGLEVTIRTESGELVKTSDLEQLSVDSNDSKESKQGE